MKRKWIWPTLTLLIILSITSWYTNNETSEPKFTPLAQTKSEDEMQQKIAILNEDINTSSALNKTEALNDIKKLAFIGSYKEAKEELEQIMVQHPHFVYINWEKDRHKVQVGTTPKISSNDGQAELAKINEQLFKDKMYISPLLKADDLAQYQIIALKDNNVTTQVYVKQSILPQVEKHQKNNLRLIPYPNETAKSEYETVKANSTQPMDVNSAEQNEDASHFYDNEVVVKFKNKLQENEISNLLSELDAVTIFQLNSTYIFKSSRIDTTKLIEHFNQHADVEFVEPHYIYITNTITNNEDQVQNETDNNNNAYEIVPNDALFSTYQWNLPQIATSNGWNYSKGSTDVTIAILDTGVNFTHPDLSTRMLEGTNTSNENGTANDDVGHGTHVTGIIGAEVNNNEGIAGISWYNNLLPVKVLNGNGYGSTYAVAQGIIWATDQGAKVINMSLGNYASAQFLHDAIKYAYERDVVLIAATGNDNTNRPGYPAAYPEVLAVGATNSKRERAIFSNYGDYVDVVAPGDQIPSTYLNGQYAALSGTSMATPHVAALAGLIRSINPSLSNVQVMDVIRQTAVDLGDEGHDIYFGYGEINIERALALAASYNGTLQTYTEDTKAKINKIIQTQ